MKPFTADLLFVVAAKDLADAQARYDRVLEYAESLGFHPEGGMVRLMSRHEVLPDSPLALDL